MANHSTVYTDFKLGRIRMENNQIQNTEVKEPIAPETNNGQAPQEPEVKTFTQDEVNKMIEKRLAREKKDSSTDRKRKRRICKAG